MNESQKHFFWVYETSHKREHTTLFHLYEIIKQKKRISGVNFRILFDAESVGWWYLDRTMGYPGVYTCQYSVNVYLIVVHFIACKFYVKN